MQKSVCTIFKTLCVLILLPSWFIFRCRIYSGFNYTMQHSCGSAVAFGDA